MALILYFSNAIEPPTHRADQTAMLNGTTSFWGPLSLSITRFGAAASLTVTTVAGPTNGLEIMKGTVPAEWISSALSADFTISGTITLNLWASELAAANNASINAVIEKINGATGALTQIAKTARTTELGTSLAAANFTVAPTSTACKRGDRLRIRVYADDAASSMGSAGTVTFSAGSPAGGSQGDSWVQFTENLTFEPNSAAGSKYYLIDDAESINPGAATEKKATTARGATLVTSVTNTATGPTAGIQATDSAGGTALEWYTPPLEAVTIGGVASVSVRASESNAAANASLVADIAVVAGNGTGAVVWAKGARDAASTNGASGEIGTTDGSNTITLSGADTALTAGQRLRFRLFVDDCASAALVSGHTVSIPYSGPSGVAGNSAVTLPVAVTEQVSGTTYTKAGSGKENG
jgi:hypothetical protein